MIEEIGSKKPEESEILREWVQGCALGRDFLTYWVVYFIERLELIVKHKPSQGKEVSERFEEFRRMNHSYLQLVEAFYEKASTTQIPKNLEDNYNKFVKEYDAFIQTLRSLIDEASKVFKVSVDSKNIQFAKELRRSRYG